MADEVQNTDREIWRRTPGDFYSPSIHVTAEGGIGIDIGGRVIVMDVEDWFLCGAAGPPGTTPLPPLGDGRPRD